jgi:hypothetical protein
VNRILETNGRSEAVIDANSNSVDDNVFCIKGIFDLEVR